MIKRLLKCVREYKLSSVLAPAFVIGEVVLEVIIPVLMALLIDNGILKQDMSYILLMGAILLVACLCSLSCGVLSGLFAAKASAGVAKNMRKDMFYNIQRFSFKNIDKFKTSSLVTRLTTDVTNVQNAYQMLIRGAIRSPIMLISSVAVAMTINFKLSLIFVAVIPILAIALYLIITRVHSVFMKMFKGYDKLNNVVGENLHGIRVVKSFVREEHEKKKFFDISDYVYKLGSKAEKIIALNMPVMNLCVYGSIIAISWIGATIVVNSGETELTTGELTSMFTYAMQMLMSLMMLSMIMVMIIMSRASIQRIHEVLVEEPEITPPSEPDFVIPDGSIEFKNVTFSYANDPDKACLSDINLNNRYNRCDRFFKK